jgi:acetylglutamate kinase
LTDVPGVLEEGSVVPEISLGDLDGLILSHRVTGGMVLKLEACRRAMEAGVRRIVIVGGTQPEALVAAVKGARGGTRIVGCIPEVEEAVVARFATGGLA